MQSKIKIEDFDYELPEEKIAFFPLEERDNSKLLIYKGGEIHSDIFKNIGKYLPGGTLLVFNDTKVVKARLLFHKATGAKIELLCLEPTESGNISEKLDSRGRVVWNCLVGNSRRWVSGELTSKIIVKGETVNIKAEREKVTDDHSEVLFSWDSECTFAEVLECFGKVPLPPYIHRESVQSDSERYQTVYAVEKGSVAAPTAGLHFTPQLIESLKEGGVDTAYLTLHVGLGTFKPVNEEFVDEHKMHSERIVITKELVEKLYSSYRKKSIIPVGTTSCRSLESLYWLGVKIKRESFLSGDLELDQWYPYESGSEGVPVEESLGVILEWLDKRGMRVLEANTSLMITPEYRCRLADAIITNFHQPKSTLLLLISSILGGKWKDIYKYAIDNNFRFLSYGDSCLFFNSR